MPCGSGPGSVVVVRQVGRYHQIGDPCRFVNARSEGRGLGGEQCRTGVAESGGARPVARLLGERLRDQGKQGIRHTTQVWLGGQDAECRRHRGRRYQKGRRRWPRRRSERPSEDVPCRPHVSGAVVLRDLSSLECRSSPPSRPRWSRRGRCRSPAPGGRPGQDDVLRFGVRGVVRLVHGGERSRGSGSQRIQLGSAHGAARSQVLVEGGAGRQKEWQATESGCRHRRRAPVRSTACHPPGEPHFPTETGPGLPRLPPAPGWTT